MTKERKPTVTITLNERELYLLANGFGTSYIPDQTDPDNVELQKISDKLNRAHERIWASTRRAKRRTVGFV